MVYPPLASLSVEDRLSVFFGAAGALAAMTVPWLTCQTAAIWSLKFLGYPK